MRRQLPWSLIMVSTMALSCSSAGGSDLQAGAATGGAGGAAGAAGNGGTTATPAECELIGCVQQLPTRLELDLAAPLSSGEALGCSPQTATEQVLRVSLTERGFFLATMTSLTHAPLELVAAREPNVCLDQHPTRVGALLDPGDYYVLARPTEAAGAATLELALTTSQTFEAAGVQAQLAADALTVLGNAWAWGASRRSEYALVDFTLHSSLNREWVFDLATSELLWNMRVAHGRKSSDPTDLAHARYFSNESGSNQSSLGLYRTATTYVGTFGPSYRLEGLEPGHNDAVCQRDIVMHPWQAMRQEYVDRCGWARPSLGCPAIDDTLSMPVRDRLARPAGAPLEMGSLMLIWHPGSDWHLTSEYLHANEPSPQLTAQLAVECMSEQSGTSTPPQVGDYGCD